LEGEYAFLQKIMWKPIRKKRKNISLSKEGFNPFG
jgi:hypothetical protein